MKNFSRNIGLVLSALNLILAAHFADAANSIHASFFMGSAVVFAVWAVACKE